MVKVESESPATKTEQAHVDRLTDKELIFFQLEEHIHGILKDKDPESPQRHAVDDWIAALTLQADHDVVKANLASAKEQNAPQEQTDLLQGEVERRAHNLEILGKSVQEKITRFAPQEGQTNPYSATMNSLHSEWYPKVHAAYQALPMVTAIESEVARDATIMTQVASEMRFRLGMRPVSLKTKQQHTTAA
ncbi:MAG TPA: hypothetical protein VLF93_00375 [Candidatus Saccharimonadales bacterium]|nr:hypothetical protein [Candidatus Saccharimonadales bacterium]